LTQINGTEESCVARLKGVYARLRGLSSEAECANGVDMRHRRPGFHPGYNLAPGSV
jgi:hypothetical protein